MGFCDQTAATREMVMVSYFQYSLRIVGFCDTAFPPRLGMGFMYGSVVFVALWPSPWALFSSCGASILLHILFFRKPQSCSLWRTFEREFRRGNLLLGLLLSFPLIPGHDLRNHGPHSRSLQNRRNSQATHGARLLGPGGICSPRMVSMMVCTRLMTSLRSRGVMRTSCPRRLGKL